MIDTHGKAIDDHHFRYWFATEPVTVREETRWDEWVLVRYGVEEEGRFGYDERGIYHDSSDPYWENKRYWIGEQFIDNLSQVYVGDSYSEDDRVKLEAALSFDSPFILWHKSLKAGNDEYYWSNNRFVKLTSDETITETNLESTDTKSTARIVVSLIIVSIVLIYLLLLL